VVIGVQDCDYLTTVSGTQSIRLNDTSFGFKNLTTLLVEIYNNVKLTNGNVDVNITVS